MWLLPVLTALGLAGCDGSVAVQPYTSETDPAKLYMRLRLDQGAINLSTAAPFNTLQLTATPFDGLDRPILDLPAPTFYLAAIGDTIKVRVTPEGLVTGLQAATEVLVIAELRAANNIRHADTAVVNVAVADPPPTPATLSIDPVPPADSALVPMFGGGTFISIVALLAASVPFDEGRDLSRRLQVLTEADETISGVTVEYFSLDSTIARVGRRNGTIETIRPGKVNLVARTFAYGVVLADTVEFTVTPPIAQNPTITTHPGMSIFGPAITIRPSGFVFWANLLDHTLDIVFDDPTFVAAPPAAVCAALIFVVVSPGCDQPGNFTIVDTTLQVRQFPVPGIYTYREAHTGAVGKVVVTYGTTP